jgi:toxin-antitoxin system PIN domain toxin
VTATLDTNVLLYASDESCPFHGPAIDLLETLAAGPDLVYLFWPVALGYLRISTHPAIFQKPLSPAEAMANLDDFVTRPHVRTGGEADDFWDTYRELASLVTVRGNLVPVSHVVALMRQHGVSTIWSQDRDFLKFPGIKVQDPFARLDRRAPARRATRPPA